MGSTQRAKWTTAQDGVENLAKSEDRVPEPGRAEVLVEILAVSLDYRDQEGMLFPYGFPGNLC
jgi:NADPH:quinone reductase-like Zn-dependent oxidoreductase